MGMKEDFEKKLEDRLREYEAEIESLRKKAEEAGAEARDEYMAEVNKLGERKAEAEEKLQELKQAGDTTWENLKAGAESAWDSLEEGVRSAASRFG
jgi:seryl-tRNA synthetase